MLGLEFWAPGLPWKHSGHLRTRVIAPKHPQGADIGSFTVSTSCTQALHKDHAPTKPCKLQGIMALGVSKLFFLSSATLGLPQTPTDPLGSLKQRGGFREAFGDPPRCPLPQSACSTAFQIKQYLKNAMLLKDDSL